MNATTFLALLTLISNAAVICFPGLWLWGRVVKGNIWKKVERNLIKYSLKIMLLVSLTSMLGSLYFSEIRGFTPCKLCWYQRIFMYPQVIILAIALLRKLKDVFYYTLVFSFIGGIIAIYNYFLQLNPNQYAPCELVGFSVSCNERFFTYFGYITIPWMSFSAFAIIFLLSYLNISHNKN
jgi:disulfide bond formation protein DsbB